MFINGYHFSSTKNLNQTSASPLNLKFKILTKPSFGISTKIQLHNLYKTSTAKCWTKSSFKILPELQLQNLDQPCAQSLNKSLALGPNVSSQICNKLLPTWSSASTWATVTASTSFDKNNSLFSTLVHLNLRTMLYEIRYMYAMSFSVPSWQSCLVASVPCHRWAQGQFIAHLGLPPSMLAVQ